MATSSDVTAPESEVPVLEYNIDDVRVSHYFSCLVRGAGMEPVILIETDFLKELLDLCTKQQRMKGVAIRGPSGTGKSTSSLYLWNRLRNLETPIPFLVCSPQCLNTEIFYPYIESFCEENEINEEMGNIRSLKPVDILNKILDTLMKLQKLKPVLFVDLCCVTTDQQDIPNLVRLALKATLLGCCAVVAYSSSGGSMNDRSTPTLAAVKNNLETLDSMVELHESTVFSDREAKKFIDKFEVDGERLEKERIEVANNPYLLSLFSGTVSRRNRFYHGRRLFDDRMNELTRTFISTLYNPVYSSAFNHCLELLECARHNVDLNASQLEQYHSSYLGREYLTTLEVGEGSYRVKLLFPPMYNRLVERLKGGYLVKHEKEVLALPIVQWYVFESQFLQCKHLHRLAISAVMEETDRPKVFSFSSLFSASVQETGTLDHPLVDNQIYHLRPKHPAIDGVCVAIDSNDVRYLLLLQVSLSEYRKHESKGKDIRKQVDKNFEGKVRNETIAEYYKHLAEIEQDKNVIYVYVSPKEDKPPTNNAFAQDLKIHDTKTSLRSFPQYFYGFCVDSDSVIQHCLPPDHP